MKKYALHTMASRARVHYLISDELFTQSAVVIVPGLTTNKEPDCFFGWGERHVDLLCQDHTIVQSDDLADLHGLSKALIKEGHQTVLTLNEDWSEVMFDSPIFLLPTHTH